MAMKLLRSHNPFFEPAVFDSQGKRLLLFVVIKRDLFHPTTSLVGPSPCSLSHILASHATK
jgi:hypothetical protein